MDKYIRMVCGALLINVLFAAAVWAQPAVNGSTPGRNATNVALNANINIGFNQTMDASTINDNSIIVQGSFRGRYAGEITYGGTTAVFNPDVDFLPGEVVTVLVTPEAKSTSDVPLARGFTYNFTAAASGFGLFEQPVTFTGVPDENATDVVAADFNGNGRIDVAVLSQGANAVYVHFSNGDGTFATPVVLENRSGAIAMKLVAADVNGNGNPDLLVANISAFSLSVFLNNGDGTFNAREDYATSASLGASDMVVMDITGNGILDVVQLHYGSPSASQFLFHYSNDGSGAFGTGSQITIADLNGGGSLAVSYHNATTMFSNSQYQWRPHVLVTDYTNNQLRVYENDGSGTGYEFAQTTFAGTNPVAVGGFRLFTNSPGADAVVLNSGSNNMTVFTAPTVSSGDSFGSQSNFSTGNGPNAVAGGDLNGDGTIDLVVVNGGNGTISYLPNTTGTFNENNSLSVGANAAQVVLADMNGNGRLDLVTANTNGSVSILYNYPGPEIVTTSPQSIGAYDDLEIEFSVDFMDATTMTTANVIVKDATDAVIPSSFSFAGGTLTITPDEPLHQGTTVTVQLTAGVTTTSGHALANPGTINFNVAASVLELTSTSPAAYNFQHPLSSGLSLSFDETIVLSTLDAGVSVSGSIRGAYTGTWSGSTTVTFTPASNFLPGEQIAVTAGTSVLSLSGASLDESYTFTFATDSNPLGSFLASSEFTTALSIQNNIVITDMTNNGNPDVVIWGYDWQTDDYYIKVTTSDGAGNLVATTTTIFEPYRPKAFLVADFNNDGNKDVVILDSHVDSGGGEGEGEGEFLKTRPGSSEVASGENTTSLFFFAGNGDGSLQAPTSISLPSDYEIKAFSSADITGNGNIDLVFPREDGNDVIIALGNGNGTFVIQSPIAAPGGPTVAKLADINLDGVLDLVIGTSGTNGVSVRYGNGDGTFGTATTTATGIQVYDILIADFNNDGRADLAVLDGEDRTEIMLNNGVGGFTSTQIFTTGWLGAVIDFNGDDYPDLVFNDSGASIHTNNGDGTFSTTPKIFNSPYISGLAVADMTGNGSVDIIGHSGSEVFVLASAEPVLVTATSPALNALNVPAATAITATFNVDMNASTFTASNVSAYSSVKGTITGTLDYNAGTRTVTFTPASSFLPGEVVTVTLTNSIESTAGVPLEKAYSFGFTAEAAGNGSFVYNNALNTGSVTNSFLYAADVDGDGDEDLIGFSNAAVKVYKNNAGTFSEFSSLAVAGMPEHGILGDFNNDGHIDIAYRRPFSTTNIYLLENDGTGTFTSAGTNNIGSMSQNDAITADFDNDGNLDIAYITGSQQVLFLWGNGDFTFTSGFFNISGHTLSKIAAGDVNKDGTVDLVGYDNNGKVVVIHNNGGRSFAKSTDIANPIAANGIALADFSGNGYLDIVLTSRDDNAFAVVLNQGNGTYASAISYEANPYQLNRVVPFDFTGNGTMDLALHATDDEEGVNFLLMAYNDGNGGFGNQLSFEIPSVDPDFFYGFSSGFALLDANGDGAIDVASRITNGTDQFIAFAFNEALSGAGSVPTSAATSATTSNIRFSSATLSWTNGDGARRLVLVKEGAPVDATLTNDAGYGANPAFGSGTEVGTGNFVVYGGNGNSVSVSGLEEETEYHFAVYEINGIPGQEKVLTTTPATGSFTTVSSRISFDDTAGFALAFNGVNHRTAFDAGDNNISGLPDPVTFEMWVKPTGFPETGAMVFASGDDDAYQIGIDQDGKFFTQFYDDDDGDYIRATGTTTANANQWYHIAASAVSDGHIKLYVNGVQEASESISEVYTTNNAYWFGYAEYDGDSYFQGELDEIRIWRVERTASEIRANKFNTSPVATAETLLLAWQFNEGSGNTATDRVNEYNLELDYSSSSRAPSWVTSTIPIGALAEVSSGVQSGTTSVGNAALTLTTPFENPVDVFFNEITSEPNQFPTGATASLGGKYFVIDLVGDPGTFSLDLTLTFGPGAVTEAQEANPSAIKLFRRSSSSTGEWTELSGATSAIASSGAVTWSGITSFSQFIAIVTESEPGTVGIDDTNIIVYDEAAFTFASDFFAFTGAFDDATLTVTADVTTSGTLFVDANDNSVYDDGTDLLLVAETGVSYTASSDKLVYIPSALGTDTVTLSFSDGTDTDEVTLTFISVVASPELPGVADEGGWYLLANPLESSLGTLLSNVWTQGAENSNAPAGDATLYTYNMDTSSFEAITGDLNETTLAQGTGLAAYLFAFDDFSVGVPDGGGWPKTLSNEGNPFGTTATIPVRNVDHDGVAGTSGTEGFILFGNPFGWSISAEAVIARLKSVDPLANSYVYRWNPVARTYQLITSGGIAPYEAVFIRAITSELDETISFDYDDAQNVMNKAAKEEDMPMFAFTLNHIETAIASQSWIRIDEEKGSSAGIDPYDGYYLGTYATTFANLYTQVGDQSLVINNLPASLSHEAEFPIYLHNSIQGEFELSWDADVLPEGWELMLTEVSTGAQIDIHNENTFTFTVDKLAAKINREASLNPSANQIQSGDQPLFILHVKSPAVGTSVEELADIPDTVELRQNFPNPFNPSTTIQYGVPAASNVRLEVFDVLGRRVVTLVNNEMRQPGRYAATFDARNLASGVYVYRLIVGDHVITKQMMLIK